ncbi:MAG: P1 family peptidase [Cohaesibacteraceae bacterium]|nr:P1 family peptidase [Cohaesibacteraceae bacterium]
MKRIRDYGIVIGTLPTGPTNSLADVDGVTISHVTLSDGAVQTGVSVIHPGSDHPFYQKRIAASHVINGFGKSIGLVQLDELGTLETPIILTNTLSVGTASTALVEYMLAGTPEIGDTTGTVNPVVMECNDGAYLNDIRGLHVTKEHVAQALAMSSREISEGNIGAGTGMSCYGLKGGVGTSSRMVEIGSNNYTIAAYTLCNMGLPGDLLVDGQPVGSRIVSDLAQPNNALAEKGSIIVVLATDAPVDARQLKRITKRAGMGIARTGTSFGSGSGDIIIGFTTAGMVPHLKPDNSLLTCSLLHEDALDSLFRGAIEVTQEAILNTLVAAKPVTGRNNRTRQSLAQYAHLFS